MNPNEYIKENKFLQQTILDYLSDNEEFISLISLINLELIRNNRNYFKAILYLILNVANNFIPQTNFYSKIEPIFAFFNEEANNFFQNLTKYEIFNIFKSNKLLLLLLFEKKIIEPDQKIVDMMMKGKYQREGNTYLAFFMPEIKQFLQNSNDFKKIDNLYQENIENFNERRRTGQNHCYISYLIRNDDVDEFIPYINRQNISVSSTIEPSLFETNSYLINKRISYIEYASFFGSFQIFKYIQFQNVLLSSSLWIFTIHSQNSSIIHILEDLQIKPHGNTYNECLTESIKCHYNDMAEFIQSTYNESSDNTVNTTEYIKYFNYHGFPDDVIENQNFFDFCQYDYAYLVKLILDESEVDVNRLIKI